MSLDYAAKLDAVVAVLQAHNTTTASPDLSANLTSRLANTSIVADDPEIRGIRNYDYPAIFVRIGPSTEEFEGIGPSGGGAGAFKRKDITFHVFAMYRREGANASDADTMRELYNLVRNIEDTFRTEYQLNNTALFSQPRSSDFLGPFSDETGWIKIGRVELEARYHFR